MDYMDFTRECSSLSLLSIISMIKKILALIQIIVPIILIIFATKNIILIITNPEIKNKNKKIINQFLAAAIIFFIPVIVNATMNTLGVSYNVSACWTNADEFKITSTKYIPISEEERKKLFSNASEYELGNGSECGEKIARLAVELAGTASPEPFIKSPNGANYCAFNKSNDPRLAKYNQVHDSRVSCNHAYASCTQAAATIIDTAADPEINWMSPKSQFYYLQHSPKWQEVEKPDGISWKEILQPGDVGEAIWNEAKADDGHSWIYVGNEIARERFPNTDGFIYDGGYSSCKNPHINPNDGLVDEDKRIHYFRFIGDCSEADTINVRDGYGGPTDYGC